MSTCSLTYGSGTSYPVPDGRKLAEGPTPVNIDFSADRGPGAGGNAAGRAPMRGPALGLSLDLADVGGLEPLRAPAHLELDPITLGQALEARSLNGAEVHEHILATLLGDETEPLRIVEPLHAALSHLYLPLSCEACASVMPHHHGGGALRDRKANKNAAGLEVLTALISNLANPCSLRIRLPVNPKPDQSVSHDGRVVKGCRECLLGIREMAARGDTVT